MIGKIIQNFKIISELGQGGMGIIYKAYDTKLDRYVAIKILKSKVTDHQKFIARFKVEAKNQAKLSHQNIVPVYGFIDEAGILGIVMELVEGETLEQLIERKIRLSLEESIEIIKQILTGIGYAHSKGFIHRDIKPSNIIIGKDKIAKIMDFGISKSIFEKSFTNTGTNIGTLYYMSPEQIRGEELTLQSDIYSIGITLYEMLSGVVPFDYDNEYQVIEGHLKESAPELLGKSPGLPLSIQRIVEKAISKKPQSRYSDPQEFLNDLAELKTEINRFTRPRVVQNTNGSKKHKFKAVTYTGIIISLSFFLFYFSYTQVNELWKNGINPFLVTKKSKNSAGEIELKNLSKIKWTPLLSGIISNLNSVYFINDSTGFCCGAEGKLLSTFDYGATWKIVSTPSAKEFVSLCFNGSSNGFLIDESSIYRSTDHGVNWKRSDIDCSGKKLLKIKFIDNLNGFITGTNGLILKTSDGGISWRQAESRTNALLYDLDFPDYQNGFAVGWNGEILKSTDSGETWARLNPLTTNYLKRIKFINRTEGFVIGGGGEIFRTTDAGSNWVKVENTFSFSLYDIQFIDERIALIIGGQGKVLMSTDRGNNWFVAESNIYAGLNELFLTSQNKLFAVGANGTIVRL